MSSDADANAAAIVALVDSLYNDSYFTLAISVLFIYDSLVILDREVACFWTVRRTGASPLFFANKWISMTVFVMELGALATFPSDKVGVVWTPTFGSSEMTMDVRSCSMYGMALLAVEALQFVPSAAFSALRAYGLSRSKLLGLVVLVLSMGPVAGNLAIYGYQLSGENILWFGCHRSDSATVSLMLSTNDHFERLVISARIPLIIADVILIYITWSQLRCRDALNEIRQSKRLSLSNVLFRDGTIYFVVLFVLNVLHLVFTVTSLALSDEGTSYVTIFTGPITAIIVSRFLLDLQEANQMVIRLGPDASSDSCNNTSSFISSLGAFINPDLTASDEFFESPMGSHCDGEEKGGTQASQAVASSSSA
ncbi:hypothetical protein OH76DRAFT_1479098 [Lentinus brumalis]|uniref:DUF6533 domain-containing protein n=1 Tax=Lentinus brumalis TaxID=2498619 RepID=A0A371DNF5_9APHY|nr:hypothetical protein OH76DRAFT_1479098 [Polyporus brumalis]